VYKVTLQVLVMNGRNKELSSDWFYATNEIELPFLPYPNLKVRLGSGFPGRGLWHIKNVTWLEEGNLFLCDCEDKALDLINVDQLTYADWLAILPSWGWQIFPKSS
jgi:hypothetical protein